MSRLRRPDHRRKVCFRPLADPTLLTTLCLVEPSSHPSPYFRELLDLATAHVAAS